MKRRVALSFRPWVWLGLLLGCEWCLGEADSGLGVMWRPPVDAVAAERVQTDLHTGRLAWVREMEGWQPAAGKRSILWWPRASRVDQPLENLWAIYREALEAPPSVAGADAVEVGNEPDLHFTHLLPDEMAAVFKAAAAGLRAKRLERKVLMPALAAEPGPYADLLVRNGILPFTDAWNVHFYGWAQDYGAALANHRLLRDRAGGRGLPLWVTELGLADFPSGAPAGGWFHPARQQAFFEQAAVRGLAAGAAQQWAFCAGPYVMNERDHGMHNADFSPRPAWDSWVVMGANLSGARLRFRLRDEADGQERGWVLEKGGGTQRRWWTILVSSHRWGDVTLPAIPPGPPTTLMPVQLRFPPEAFPVQLGLTEHREWTGGQLDSSVSSTNNLHLWTAPIRFTVAGCRWEPVSLDNPARNGPRRSDVVVTLRPVGLGVTRDKMAVTHRVAGCLPVCLEVTAYNFGQDFASGSWRLDLPEGWRLSEESSRRGALSLAGLAHARWKIMVRVPAGASMANGGEASVVWRGKDGGTDEAIVRLSAAGMPANLPISLGGEWEPTEPRMVWQREIGDYGNAVWWCDEGGKNPSLVLNLPQGRRLEPDDLLQMQLRLLSASGRPVSARLELVTSNRRVFGTPVDLALTGYTRKLELRVGDATPAIWSHATLEMPTDACFVRLSFFGLDRRQQVELSDLKLTPAQ